MTPERGSRDTHAGRSRLKESLDRDLDRYARRERDASSFWRSLGVLGSVGWPIVLAAVGGALAGRWLDARYDSGIRFTLGLLTAGVAVGVSVAWQLVRPER